MTMVFARMMSFRATAMTAHSALFPEANDILRMAPLDGWRLSRFGEGLDQGDLLLDLFQ